MKVEQWSIARVKPYERNARIIPPSAIEKVALSIQKFGWQQPIVVDSAGVIVAGHTRLLAAQKLGLKKVPVHVAAELSAEQIKAYRLMDNRSHQESEWNDDLLRFELGALAPLDLAVTGFDADELTALLVSTSDEPPDTFQEFDENIEIEHICPRCKFRFSGGETALRNSEHAAVG